MRDTAAEVRPGVNITEDYRADDRAPRTQGEDGTRDVVLVAMGAALGFLLTFGWDAYKHGRDTYRDESALVSRVTQELTFAAQGFRDLLALYKDPAKGRDRTHLGVDQVLPPVPADLQEPVRRAVPAAFARDSALYHDYRYVAMTAHYLNHWIEAREAIRLKPELQSYGEGEAGKLSGTYWWKQLGRYDDHIRPMLEELCTKVDKLGKRINADAFPPKPWPMRTKAALRSRLSRGTNT